jgi:hypothetical protein
MKTASLGSSARSDDGLAAPVRRVERRILPTAVFSPLTAICVERPDDVAAPPVKGQGFPQLVLFGVIIDSHQRVEPTGQITGAPAG